MASGDEIIIDTDDLSAVLSMRWRSKTLGNTKYAASHAVRGGPGARGDIYLHRYLMDAPGGLEVDHINGNGLDNRRQNLRLCTVHENRQNVDHGRGRMRNVYHEKRTNKWFVSVTANGVKHHGGTFGDVEAAVAAASALRQMMSSSVEDRHK